jgi:DNA-binding beta-propeller fold protein YncE
LIGARRVVLAAVLAAFLAAGAAPAALAAGELMQLRGLDGCVTDEAFSGRTRCAQPTTSFPIRTLGLSPDGATAYLASSFAAGGSPLGGVMIFDRDPASGALRHRLGQAGCIGEVTAPPGEAPACAVGRSLLLASALVVSQDGRHVYVAGSGGNGGLAVLDRDLSSGALAQRAGRGGCVLNTGTRGTCADGKALDFPISIVLSPDGTSLYVASLLSSSLTVFDRDTATGAIRQKSGRAGCMTESGSRGRCTRGRALLGAHSVAASPDGRNVYVASIDRGAVAVFDRDRATGRLTQKRGRHGCISKDATHRRCIQAKALRNANGVTVSPDGKNVYVTAFLSDSLAIFDRRSGGALVQKRGRAGCVSETGHDGACANGTALRGATSVAVAPDGRTVYASAFSSDAVTVFDRRSRSGALTQKDGRAGCLSVSGTRGACSRTTSLEDPRYFAFSPDGTSLYVTGRRGISVFRRKRIT